MPTKPKRPCRKPGCRALTADGWCDEHRPASARAWATTTTSAHARGYGALWRKLRRLILARDPVCAECGHNASTEVDHLVPKSRGGQDTEDNLRGICGDCHSRKTLRESREARSLRSPGCRGWPRR